MHDISNEQDELLKKVFKLIDDKQKEMIKYCEEKDCCHTELVEKDIKLLSLHVDGAIQLNSQQIEDLLSNLIQYRVCLDVPLPKGAIIARARKIDDGKKYPHYDDARKLSYIPLQDQCKIKTPGRFNSRYQSMFYGSVYDSYDDLKVPFHEIGVQANEYINILISEVSEDLNVRLIGLFSHLKHQSNMLPWIHSIFNDINKYYQETHESNLLNAIEIVDEFFKEISSKEVFDEEKSKVYDITSVLGNIYLVDLSIDGLIYPSVKVDGLPNIVIRPSSVGKKVKYLKANIAWTDDDKNGEIIIVKELNTGNIVNNNIEWKLNKHD